MEIWLRSLRDISCRLGSLQPLQKGRGEIWLFKSCRFEICFLSLTDFFPDIFRICSQIFQTADFKMYVDTVAEIICGYLMKTISSNSNMFLKNSWFENFKKVWRKMPALLYLFIRILDQGHSPTETLRMFKNSLVHKYP